MPIAVAARELEISVRRLLPKLKGAPGVTPAKRGPGGHPTLVDLRAARAYLSLPPQTRERLGTVDPLEAIVTLRVVAGEILHRNQLEQLGVRRYAAERTLGLIVAMFEAAIRERLAE